MNFLILFSGIMICFSTGAQTVLTHQLDANNINVTISDGGIFFNDPVNGHGFEAPKGTGLHTVYAMSFMYGAVDVNNQLKFSGQLYTSLSDQFKGPLTTDGSAQADQTGAWDASSIFPISKQEIFDHVNNYSSPGYIVPNNILNWPAHGDVSLGFDFYLAPFVDVDQDGVYNPFNGDYPCVRGDKALYVIMNDNAQAHASGGIPLGIEMHYMFYQYSGPGLWNDAVFVNGKVINRGTQVLNDFKVSVFLDADIGNPQDDYFGSGEWNNLMYFYNDSLDEMGGGSAGYQSNPPAFGVCALSDTFEHVGLMTEQLSTPVDYWNFMNGQNITGAPWQDVVNGGETNFMYQGEPFDPSDMNTEIWQGNLPGDRRGIATLNGGTLGFGDEMEFDVAFVSSAYYGTALGNAFELSLYNPPNIGSWYFYQQQGTGCDLYTAELGELSEVEFSIYPNPSNGQFTISFGTDFSNAEIEIYDVSGRVVLDRMSVKSEHATIELNQPSGLYIVHLTIDGQKNIQKIVLE